MLLVGKGWIFVSVRLLLSCKQSFDMIFNCQVQLPDLTSLVKLIKKKKTIIHDSMLLNDTFSQI